jgi:signal transduction histidine kinase
MGTTKHDPHPLLIEVSHQVNSPLAAIRNAIYLASKRTADPEIIEYLAIADGEISSIVNRIKSLRAEVEATYAAEAPCAFAPVAEMPANEAEAA